MKLLLQRVRQAQVLGWIARTPPLLCSLALPLPSFAQAAPAGPASDVAVSRITEVTLYPGTATVQRVARVPAGSRTLRLDCLPATLDVQSLQVFADAGVRVGETTVLAEDRATSAACRDHPLDARIRTLQDQKAALQAEHDALDLVTGYLKNLGGGTAGTPAAAPDAKAVAGVADAVRRTGQDALARQHQTGRAQADIERQLAPLQAERERAQQRNTTVFSVAVNLSAPREAEVALRYQLRGPGWTPAYRAQLDTATRRVRLERQALVAQASGEDWRGVRLRLSTGQPLR
ncbi:MAG TPA: mucoidy inhibitor MuiA family protein, partial [Pseudorhodoferax sp.]|nr:mucoidy inhibitor MuiA family protein [Pseudorhodoferax sp.]